MGTERRGIEPWPYVLAGALALMISISVAFLWVSIAHPDAVLVHDAWAVEPEVAAALRARGRAEAQRWDLAVRTRPEADGVAVEAELRDAEGRSLLAERVLVLRERPAEGGLDAEVTLMRDGDVFKGHVSLPLPGRWQLVVRAEREGALAERRVTLRGPG